MASIFNSIGAELKAFASKLGYEEVENVTPVTNKESDGLDPTTIAKAVKKMVDQVGSFTREEVTPINSKAVAPYGTFSV